MPDLIVSDIHANLEALEAVLEDARGRYDRIFCLGDLVGYGADPNPVVEWARESAALIIRGNHDRASVVCDPMENFNPAARISTDWTRQALTPASREFLGRLPRGPLSYEGIELVHGSPADEDEYLFTPDDAALLREDLGAALTFFGHTHRQGGFLLTRRAGGYIDPRRMLEIETNRQYLVNPGSVGQPRDGDPRAAYALYWPVERLVEFLRVDYDVDRAAAKIRAASLPEFLAARLYEGV